MNIFLTVLSFLSFIWLAVQLVQKFVLGKRTFFLEHNGIKLWNLQEVGRTRMFSIKKDLWPVLVFYATNSYTYPSFERFFAWLSISVLISLVLFEPIMLFRRKYPIQSMWIARVSLVVMACLLTVTVRALVQAL